MVASPTHLSMHKFLPSPLAKSARPKQKLHIVEATAKQVNSTIKSRPTIKISLPNSFKSNRKTYTLQAKSERSTPETAAATTPKKAEHKPTKNKPWRCE